MKINSKVLLLSIVWPSMSLLDCAFGRLAKTDNAMVEAQKEARSLKTNNSKKSVEQSSSRMQEPEEEQDPQYASMESNIQATDHVKKAKEEKQDPQYARAKSNIQATDHVKKAKDKDPQELVVDGHWDRNDFFKIIDRKLLAARTADWNVKIMPYEELIKLQHVLILLTPFFQPAYADTSDAAFQQSKARSNVLIGDVRKFLFELLATPTSTPENLNTNQEKVKKLLGDFDANRSVTYAEKATREEKQGALEVIKALRNLKNIFETLRIRKPLDYPDVPKAENVLNVLHARMRFLEDAANEAVTKRYDPYRKTNKVEEKHEIAALNRPVDKFGAGDRLEKREQRTAALVTWKKAREELRDLQKKLPSIVNRKEKEQMKKRIQVLEEEVANLRAKAEDVLNEQKQPKKAKSSSATRSPTSSSKNYR